MSKGLFRRLGLVALAMLVLPILVACGGDESGPDPTATSSADTGSTDSAQAVAVDLAPEIGTIDNWYNGSATTLAELRGKPVLLIFWADY